MQLIKANVEWRQLLLLSCLIVLTSPLVLHKHLMRAFCNVIPWNLLYRSKGDEKVQLSLQKSWKQFQQFEFKWMKRAILVLLIFVCILMRGAHIVNIIVYVPWDHVWMLEGNLRCRRISFYTFKLGSIVFFSYVFQAEWPVCFWRFFCLCLLSSLRSTKSRDKYTTVVKFMCILRIQTQELTFITSDLCTEPPLQLPPIPVTKRTDPSMSLEPTRPHSGWQIKLTTMSFIRPVRAVRLVVTNEVGCNACLVLAQKVCGFRANLSSFAYYGKQKQKQLQLNITITVEDI